MFCSFVGRCYSLIHTIHTILPQRSHQTSRNHTSSPFIHHAATSQTDYENTFRRSRFPMLCTLCMELVGLWILKHYTVALLVDLNADLKLLFRQTFCSTTWTVRQHLWSHPTCWRCLNQIIIIILLLFSWNFYQTIAGKMEFPIHRRTQMGARPPNNFWGLKTTQCALLHVGTGAAAWRMIQN